MSNKSKWKINIYSKNQVNKAGNLIRNDVIDEEKRKDAIAIIDTWRAAHAYPLHALYTSLYRLVKRTEGDIIVVQRLKRLESIINKLKRETSMNLSRIQDLGGCRVILPEVEDVYYLINEFKNKRKAHIFVKEFDYIKEPKKSGYRSIHLVYKFMSKNKPEYNDMLIELQFRTKLQHIWATALETIDIFTKQSLKAGLGDKTYERYFLLISALFAIKEGQPLPPNISDNIGELKTELKDIENKLHILDTLTAINVAIQHEKDTELSVEGYYVLILNFETRKMRIRYFESKLFEKAEHVYRDIESSKGSGKIDAVLVRAKSFKDLQNAYPNYFADITQFVKIVQELIEE